MRFFRFSVDPNLLIFFDAALSLLHCFRYLERMALWKVMGKGRLDCPSWLLLPWLDPGETMEQQSGKATHRSQPGISQSPEATQRLCSKKNIICPQCDDVFSEIQMVMHIQHDHAYSCSFCPLKFTYTNGRDNHQNTAHTLAAVDGQPKLSCLACGLVFGRSKAYEVHTKKEHSVQCQDIRCPRLFTSVTLMENHAVKVHNIIEVKSAAGYFLDS